MPHNDSPPAQLQLDNQVCFALYRASNALNRAYRPLLERLDLTYPQYLVMLVLWQQQRSNVKELGGRLGLDSGTLTPLLKRLESKGLLTRARCQQDERVRIISLTTAGRQLRDRASDIPQQLACSIAMPANKLNQLKRLCEQLLAELHANNIDD